MTDLEKLELITNEAYENFVNKVDDMWQKSDIGDLDDFIYDGLLVDGTNENGEWFARILTKEEFIHKCKTDDEFAKKWWWKIEETTGNITNGIKTFNI